MQAMLGDDGGAQQGLVEGGAQSIAARLADELGDALELGTPALRIAPAPRACRSRARLTVEGLVVFGCRRC